MLRTIRLTAAIVCFTLITLLFLDFTGTLHTWFGWLAKIQFLPALLALNIGVVSFYDLLDEVKNLNVSSLGTFIKYYKISQLIPTQSIAN